MRCKECNVDLGEEYTKCPLCGADAVNEEPHLKGITTAQYPKYSPSLLTEKNEYHPTFPQKYVFRVCAILSIVLGLISYIGVIFARDSGFSFALLFEYAVPVLMGISSLFYFFYSFKEKGRLLHSVLSLLATIVVSAVFAVVAAIAHTGVMTTLASLALGVVLFVIVLILKPERTKEQLKAAFKL